GRERCATRAERADSPQHPAGDARLVAQGPPAPYRWAAAILRRIHDCCVRTPDSVINQQTQGWTATRSLSGRLQMKVHRIGSEAHLRPTHWIAVASAAFGAALTSTPAQAVDFSKGDLTGSWDTTISYGVAFRIQDSDCNLIGIADGGC